MKGGGGRHREVYCWPWDHNWLVKTGLTRQLGDSSKGELWRCQKCPKVKTK